MRAVLAALDVATESSGAAYFNRRHDAPLGEIDVTGIGSSPCLTMAAEDVR